MKPVKNANGVVMVEFALVLVPLLLLVVGFLQFGVAMHAKINGTHLTAEGARYIAVNQNPGLSQTPATTMQNYIRSRAGTAFLKGATVCIDYPVNPETGTSEKVGDPVKVRLTHLYPIVPLVGERLTPSMLSLPVAAETTMRLEALPVKVPAGCIS